jgi:hypothetical protein
VALKLPYSAFLDQGRGHEKLEDSYDTSHMARTLDCFFTRLNFLFVIFRIFLATYEAAFSVSRTLAPSKGNGDRRCSSVVRSL